MSLVAAAVGGCAAPSAQPTAAPATPSQSTAAPVVATPAAPAQPTAVPAPVAQRWEADPVLVTLYTSPGYTTPAIAWSLLPDLVVYADGTVILVSYDDAGMLGRIVESARVPEAEVCALLRGIEANGFFEYDAAGYVKPGITDNGSTLIAVDAWRSNRADLYALDYALSAPDYGQGPEVPSALADTYRMLGDYTPHDLAPYQPERVGLLVGRPGEFVDTGVDRPWPASTVALTEVLTQGFDAGYGPELILEGERAAEVYALFARDAIQFYSEGGQTYQVSVRPLLPLEIAETPSAGWGHVPAFEDAPARELACAAGER